MADFSWWSGAAKGMMWSVSQACSLRRVKIANNLLLYQFKNGTAFAGYASGGFTANVQVNGKVYSGSQQQWISRNCQYGPGSGGVGWVGASWNSE